MHLEVWRCLVEYPDYILAPTRGEGGDDCHTASGDDVEYSLDESFLLLGPVRMVFATICSLQTEDVARDG